ncbi:uncharacterized protein L201_003638 [Kwoniella dendrophila CBS 6074]|uniref:Sulfhydryl oxidase n=1 Tax=Kwoniella dendrophila CBS 6074 TaxID=1295534 RepID=A0AAX4JW45_9TREE
MTIPTSFPPSMTGFTSSSSGADPTVSTEPKRTTKETHPHLPPGLILDENGKVCKVCNTWADISKIKKKKVSSNSDESKGNISSSGLGSMAGFASMMNSSPSSSSTIIKDRKDCPADNELLGRSTWTFLHTTASYYPLKANERQQIQMKNLLESLSIFYPCNWCSKDFQKDIIKNPPIVNGRENLMKWLCERHNEVNRKLQKPEFICETKILDQRWKDGPEDGSCD